MKRFPPTSGASENVQSPSASGLTTKKAWSPKSTGDQLFRNDSGGSAAIYGAASRYTDPVSDVA